MQEMPTSKGRERHFRMNLEHLLLEAPLDLEDLLPKGE